MTCWPWAGVSLSWEIFAMTLAQVLHNFFDLLVGLEYNFEFAAFGPAPNRHWCTNFFAQWLGCRRFGAHTLARGVSVTETFPHTHRKVLALAHHHPLPP